MSDYITIQQATERFPIGRSTLYVLMASGKIKSFNLGKRRIVVESSITEYLDRLAEGAA